MTIKVNLLPTERKKIAFDPLAGILVVLCIACAVGCVFFGQSLQTQINDQENEISKTQAKIKEIEQQNQAAEQEEA